MTNVRELRALRTFLGTAFEEPRVVAADTRPWERSEIADRFKALRKKALLTQKRLGRLIGADRKTVCRIENLHNIPGPRTWRRFEELETKHNQPQIGSSMDWLRELKELVAVSVSRQ